MVSSWPTPTRCKVLKNAFRCVVSDTALSKISLDISENGPDLEEPHWHLIMPRPLVGMVVWLAVSFGFRIYLNFFNNYSRSRSLGAVIIILLFWFHATGFASLIGGEINSEIEPRSRRTRHREATAEGKNGA